MKLNRFVNLSFVFIVACNTGRHEGIQGEGYRYIQGEEIVTDRRGNLIKPAHWFPMHRIEGSEIDSFHIYGHFDSIREKIPFADPKMYRKIDLKGESWKPRSNYGDLLFVGVYSCRELDGLVSSFYFTKDKNSVLRIMFSGPDLLVDVHLFTKDSINILKEKGIIITPDSIL